MALVWIRPSDLQNTWNTKLFKSVRSSQLKNWNATREHMNKNSNCQLQRFSTIFNTLHTHPSRGAANPWPWYTKNPDTPPRQATKLTYSANLKKKSRIYVTSDQSVYLSIYLSALLNVRVRGGRINWEDQVRGPSGRPNWEAEVLGHVRGPSDRT